MAATVAASDHRAIRINSCKRYRLDAPGYQSLQFAAGLPATLMSIQRSRHFVFVVAVAIDVVVAAAGVTPVAASQTRGAAISNSAAPVAATVSSPGVNREVFGFALASSLADPTIGYPSWNFNLLTTVAFFGLHVGTSDQLVNDAGMTTWNSSALRNMVTLAHQHGVKVVLTVVLQDFSAGTPRMCAGLAHASATVVATVQQVKAKGVDGVNIDYEGLATSCGTSDRQWTQHALTSFTAKMRSALGSHYYLSV